MSTFFLADRIKELSRTETTGPIELDGAAPGFSSFDDFFASGDVVFYAITDNRDYEVGSGVYAMVGGTRTISRFPFRSSNINSGPYFVNGSSNSGPTNGQNGNFYPLWLTRSAAQSGVGFTDGPYTDIMEHTFDEYPGITFYMPSEHQGHGTGSHGGISGVSYATASQPIDFNPGVKEVFVTYPGKSAVFNGYGLEADTKEPKHSGVAFWRNESILNYSNQLVWDDTNNFLGIAQVNPEYALDIGGVPSFSIVRASGFVEGGSGIAFSGGATTYTGATASGGVQYEPFLRNEVGSGAQGLIEFSGVVNQYIGIAKQTPGTVFAGPEVDYCGSGGCPPDYPSFRLLTLDDLPLADLSSSGGFVIQQNLGLDSETANISPNNYALGMVAIYAGSGHITYDSGILFDYNNNRLLVGGDASVDVPAYTVDARGTIGSQSGYFNQLLFTDNLIRIGSQAGTNAGNTTENYHIIGIGQNAGGGTTSGVFDGVLIGRLAGLDSNTASGVVLIGMSAGRSSTELESTIGVGRTALQASSGIASGVVMGVLAGSGLKDSTHVIAIGPNAAVIGSGLNGVIAIGELAANKVSGVVNSVLIGGQAGELSLGGDNCVLIGTRAGRVSRDVDQSVFVGLNAGAGASGLNSIYIGTNPGLSVSGNNNIEITTDAPAGTSWIGDTAANKLNIERTIAGDTSAKKISIGNPSGVDPLATLTVEPADANDAALLIKLQGSGSISNPVEVQSGDGTVQFSVSNSGNVFNAGWTMPSGGIWLPDQAPTRNSGEGGFMLWNNGNTLIWNGTPVSGENAYAQWNFLTEDGGGSVTNNQQIVVSGISGIQVIASGAGNRRWAVDGGQLSGLIVELSGQIVASNYRYYTAASGDQLNNNSGKLMETDSWLVLSGVNGIEIDFLDQTDGTNSSGIFEISYNPSAAYTWKTSNGDVASATVSNDETVIFSGISGVEMQFVDDNANGSGLFTISAIGLSGTLQQSIDANLGFLSNENGPISVSGISGVAVWASGEFGRLGLGSTPGTSGLLLQDSAYIMDPDGSGNLKTLNFPNNGGRIIIGAGALGLNSWQGGPGSIIIGSGAGQGAAIPTDDNMVVIGTQAMQGNSAGSRNGMVVLGYRAFASEPFGDTRYSIAIGSLALTNSSGDYNIGIGYNAGAQNIPSVQGRRSQYNVALGFEAGKEMDGDDDGVNVHVGAYAGRYAYSGGYNVGLGNNAMSGPYTGSVHTRNVYTVGIGTTAGYGTKQADSAILIGRNAGYNASGLNYGIFIGYDAGHSVSGTVVGDLQGNPIAIGDKAMQGATDIEQTVAMGQYAGQYASGVKHSILLGRYAGYKRTGTNAIILSNRSEPVETFGDVYDAGWCPHNEDQVLDIGHTIQGVLDPCNIHIGAELNGTYRTLSDINVATVSVTPDSTADSAFVLWLHSNNGTTSSQAAGLVKTQTRDSTTIQPTLNEIINSEGFLRLPRATGVTGSYPNKTLLADGQKVKPGPGVMAVYEFSPTNRGLAIALNDGGSYTWYKLPITSAL